MELNYEKDIEIDGQSLDQEWLRQPSLFMRYSRELADAKERMSRASEKLDITKADAGNAAREKFAAENIKATVDMVRDAAQKDKNVKADTDALIKAEHEVNILTSAVRAFDHRKAALEGLVTLHGQNYFAGPSVPHDIGREFRKQVDAKGKEDARDKTTERTTRGRRG